METKKCCRCGEIKSIEDFNWKNKKNNVRRGACKICTQKFNNEKYKNDENFRKKIRERADINQKINSNYVNDIKKKNKCSKCGDNRWYVLDFHHLSDKKYEVSKLIWNSTLEKIKTEIDKCILLCSNCHREEHFLNGYK